MVIINIIIRKQKKKNKFFCYVYLAYINIYTYKDCNLDKENITLGISSYGLWWASTIVLIKIIILILIYVIIYIYIHQFK